MPSETTTIRARSEQALAKEVLDRRLIGNLLVLELEAYLRGGFPPSADVLREIMAKWRQIPAVR